MISQLWLLLAVVIVAVLLDTTAVVDVGDDTSPPVDVKVGGGDADGLVGPSAETNGVDDVVTADIEGAEGDCACNRTEAAGKVMDGEGDDVDSVSVSCCCDIDFTSRRSPLVSVLARVLHNREGEKETKRIKTMKG